METNVRGIMIRAIEKGAVDFFSTMLGIELKTEEPTTADTAVIYKDITGIIGLTGDYKGVVNIYLPDKTAFLIISSMLGVDIAEIDNDAKDAVGEISNIIVGGAKNVLYENGINCNISTPTVIVGKNYTVFSGNLEKTVIPFLTSADKFFVEFYLKKSA